MGRKFPSDGDQWTWENGWVATIGAVASNADAPKIGATCTRGTSNGSSECEYHKTFSQTWVEGLAGYGAVEMWNRRSQATVDYLFQVRLWAPDSNNYYEADFDCGPSNGVWGFGRKAIGVHNTYDVTENPDGEWVATGNPTWENLQGIEIYAQSGVSFTFDVDGLCFNYGRWRHSTSNGASITAYGQRDLIIVDDQLGNDAECQSRAETLLYQLKDPVKKLDVTTPGNRNILKGDRLSISLPAENISAANYDVLTVDHFLDVQQGWLTKAALVNSANVRSAPATSPDQIIIRQFKKLQDIARGMQTINR